MFEDKLWRRKKTQEHHLVVLEVYGCIRYIQQFQISKKSEENYNVFFYNKISCEYFSGNRLVSNNATYLVVSFKNRYFCFWMYR